MCNSNDDKPPAQAVNQIFLSVLRLFQTAGYIFALLLQVRLVAWEDGT